jgi:hypothetical protein
MGVANTIVDLKKFSTEIELQVVMGNMHGGRRDLRWLIWTMRSLHRKKRWHIDNVNNFLGYMLRSCISWSEPSFIAMALGRYQEAVGTGVWIGIYE